MKTWGLLQLARAKREAREDVHRRGHDALGLGVTGWALATPPRPAAVTPVP